MKKLSALVLALVMLLSFASAETAVIDFTSMLSEDELALGTYDTLTEDFPAKIWVLNNAFAVVDPADYPADYETDMTIGVFKYIADESLLVVFSQLPNDTGSWEDLVEGVKADPENFLEVEEAVVNGIRAIAYKCPEEDGSRLAFSTFEVDPSMYLNIMFKVSENAEFNQAASMIAASVAPVE